MALKDYASAEGVAERLVRTNPRLAADKAAWLSGHWARPGEDGRWRILGEAAHKLTSAQLYRWDEMAELWQRIQAPLLAVEAEGDSLAQWWRGSYSLQEYHERLRAVPQAQVAVVSQAGHMLHHDQPEALAALVEGFLAG